MYNEEGMPNMMTTNTELGSKQIQNLKGSMSQPSSLLK
jgi:hypothetical protein